ncbi:XrtA/PEP-CTERM system TPR-repeat protein PrsT [Paraglaciecola sp.]|uniref:XrtA/PEP-CTERM system TPR-repeat protein PrsT n=1 Tax=Paraglaciecola sp. TaxID=1920173 RepID=UPI003EF1635C
MKAICKTGLNLVMVGLLVGGLSACGKKTSEEYIQEAKQFSVENNANAAILSLKNAIQLDPKSAIARFELGQLYIQQKQFESAEKELNRALEYGYDASKVIPLLTQAYHQTGAYSAISKIEHENAGLTSVERAEIGYFKVLSLVRLNKLDEAKVLIEELASIDTSSIYKPLTSAYMFVVERDYEQALAVVVELREQAPQNAELLKLLAQLHLSLRQPNEAIDVFTEYVSLFPEDSQTMFVLAKLMVDAGKAELADTYIDKLLLINDKNPLLNQLKAATSAAKKDFASALKYAQKAINAGINETSLALIAGYSAYQIQDYSSANSHLSYVASVLPDNHPGLKLLAASQLQLGLTSEVGDVLGRLDQLSEQDAPLFSKASYELLKDGFQKEAEGLVNRSSGLSSTAEDLTRLGLLQLSLNNLDGIVNLEEAVAKSPNLEAAQTTLGKAYLATQQYDKALALANDWKASAPNDIKPFMLAGEIYTKQQKYPQAKAEFEQALGKQPNSVSPQLALVNLELAQKNVSQARQLLDDILVEFPTNVPALATQYLIAKQQGDTATAINKIQTAFNGEQSNMGLRLLLARVSSAELKYAESIELLTPIKGQENLPTGYWKILGQSYIRTNQAGEANRHYDDWLNIQPNNKDANVGKLLLLDNRNKFEDALKITSGFLKNRDDLQMQLLHVHFLLMNADYKQAQISYDALPATTLERPLVKGFLSRLQLNAKQPELAVENALTAYNAAPSTRNLLVMIASYEQLKQSEKGTDLLQEHVAKQPNDQTARMLLAERQLGSDVSSAMSSYEMAIEQNPQNYVARNNLAYLYLQAGQIDKAKEHGSEAVAIKPNNAAALDTLAQILIAEKDFSGAVKLYERAISDEMKNEEIYLNYVEALFAIDNAFLAERTLKKREYQDPVSIQRVTELKAKHKIN